MAANKSFLCAAITEDQRSWIGGRQPSLTQGGFHDTNKAFAVGELANMLAQLRGWSPSIGLQIEYSLIERTVERELVPMAKALHIGVTAWSPCRMAYLPANTMVTHCPVKVVTTAA